MENFCCTKCGSIDVFIDDRGNQKALMCNDCQSWIKWISKKSLPFAKKFIEENKQNSESENVVEEVRNEKEEIQKPDLYDFMGIVKDLLSQIDDEDLDIAATNLKNTIDDLVKIEKRNTCVGIRVRKTFDEIIYGK